VLPQAPKVSVAHAPWSRHPGESPYWEDGFVEGLIDGALAGYGLGERDPTAPLADIIEPGMTVLLKPNFVLHYNKSGRGMDCMITHPRFILATLAHVIRAKPRRIVIGDAPVQGCEIDQILDDSFLGAARTVCGDVPLEVIDFRRTVTHNQDFVGGVFEEPRSEDRYALFDLTRDSMLEAITGPLPRFRVTQHDPRKLAQNHRPHRHRYLIAREPMEADVVLNLPKLKTHHKAGINGALKNLDGINGDEAFLPHHRVGGAFIGGDCYRGAAPLKLAAELVLDLANMNIGREPNRILRGLARRINNWNLRWGNHDPNLEGSWHGNDTVWRMVLDLNRILLYGRTDGTLAERPQRRVWHLCDAIVCGEHNGPLDPEPRYLGAVTFSDAASEAERTHASLLGLDERKISVIRESYGAFRWPLNLPNATCQVTLNGARTTLQQMARQIGVDAVPPDGWCGHIELVPHNNRYVA